MFTSKLAFVALIITGLAACTAALTNSLTTPTDTQTISPSPTASRAVATQQLPTWTPTPTAIIPSVPDDKRMIASIDVGGAPWTMAVENGLLWVIVRNSIVQINPQTDKVVGTPLPVTVPENAGLEAILATQDAVWVSVVGWGDIDRRNAIDSILRIDPETGETLARIQVPRGPVSLAYTPGFVWVVNFGLNHQTVSRIDVTTNQLAGESVKTGHAPIGMAVGDGSVWVVNHDDGTLTGIDPATNQVIANILVAEPHRVAFGEGAAWVGNWHDNSISRVDPQTNQMVGELIPIGYHAGNIVAGYGNVWVTSDYRGVEAFPVPFPDHTVLVRIDPRTNKVVDTIPLGGHPVDAEVTEDAVWGSIQHPDLILKIQP